MALRKFSEEIYDSVIELRDGDGLLWREIGERLNLPAEKCRKLYDYVTNRRHRRGASLNLAARRIVSNAALLNREKREAARATQSITATFFGDPPPGFSALDRKARGL